MRSTKQVRGVLKAGGKAKISEGPHREQLKQALRLNKVVEQGPRRKMVVKLAGGGPMEFTSGGSSSCDVPETSDQSAAAERARKQQEEIRQAIANGAYKFVKTFSLRGDTNYVYKFALSEGEVNMNFACRLEEVDSWEAYERKAKLQQERRLEQSREAISEGRYRLLNAEAILVHVCVDLASAWKLEVLHVRRLDGREIAVAYPYPMSKARTAHETTWDEHLRTIAAGERVLINLRTVPQYTYELTLADGSTTTWGYAGGKPLPRRRTAADMRAS